MAYVREAIPQMSIDYSSRAYLDFKRQEEKKYPAFGKSFWDNEGTIAGEGSFRSWKWQADHYIRDRAEFLQRQLQLANPPVIERPPPSPFQFKYQPAKKHSAVEAEPKVSRKRITNSRSTGKKVSPVSMPGPTRRSTAWRKRRGGRKRRRIPPQLRSTRIPFKTVMDVNSKESSAETGFWYNHLTLKEIAPLVLGIYEEFKICGMKVRYIPQDVTSGAGLYAAVLLDQEGFGDPKKGPDVWFPRIADLPGARMCNVSRGCVFTWRPTEPDARNYRKCHDTTAAGIDYVAASFYIYGQTSSQNITGKLLITGSIRVRGEYYTASVCDRLIRLNLEDAKDATAGADSDESASLID